MLAHPGTNGPRASRLSFPVHRQGQPGPFFLGRVRYGGHAFFRPSGADASRRAELAKFVAREAYSHEVSSCGFWPGGGASGPAFYAYAYPEPKGFKHYAVQPKEAFYSEEMREFLLPYDAVRTAEFPDRVLLAFLQSTYEAAAILGKWDRPALERPAENTSQHGIIGIADYLQGMVKKDWKV